MTCSMRVWKWLNRLLSAVGVFAIIALVISAISQRLRQSLLHRGLTFMILISLVAVEVAGTCYSSVRPV